MGTSGTDENQQVVPLASYVYPRASSSSAATSSCSVAATDRRDRTSDIQRRSEEDESAAAEKNLAGQLARIRKSLNEVLGAQQQASARKTNLQESATARSGTTNLQESSAVQPGATVAAGSPENEDCVVCSDKPRDMIFIPCGHLCCCRTCGEKVGDFCPLCRMKIEIRNVVFW